MTKNDMIFGKNPMAVAILGGLAIGVAIAVALDNIAIGAGVGVALGAAFVANAKKKIQKDQEEDL